MWAFQLMKLANGESHDMEGEYVVAYDPDYHLPDGSYDGGALDTTPDPEQAGLFTFEQVKAMWYASPSCACHRLRDDGLPNRPLTAFDVVLERRGVPTSRLV